MTQHHIDYFDSQAKTFNTKYETSRSFQQRLLTWDDYLSTYCSPRGVCVDLGCGTGALSQLALHYGMQVIAVDGSKDMLCIAQDNLKAYRDQITFINEILPFNSVDVLKQQANIVICSSVIEYVHDTQLLVEQIDEILVPGGVLLISLPNKSSILRKLEQTMGKLLFAKIRQYLRHQKHQFTLLEAGNLFGSVSLVYQAHTYFGLPSLLYRWRLPEKNRYLATMLLCVFQKPT